MDLAHLSVPEGFDLVATVEYVLRSCRTDPGAVTRAARVHGVSPETVETMLLVTAVEEWLIRHPGPRATRETIETSVVTEATRAAVAAEADRSVPVTVRLEPLLAIRLVELAGITDRTPERAARDLLASHVDQAFATACQAQQWPKPTPWDGLG